MENTAQSHEQSIGTSEQEGFIWDVMKRHTKPLVVAWTSFTPSGFGPVSLSMHSGEVTEGGSLSNAKTPRPAFRLQPEQRQLAP